MIDFNFGMQSCQLLRSPQNGKYIFFDRSDRLKYKIGDLVSPTTKLILTCNYGYNSPNATQFQCSYDGHWTPTPGGCIRSTAVRVPLHTTTSAPEKQSGFNNINFILILVVAVLFVVALIAGILYKFKFKRERELKKELKSAGLDRFHKGNLKRFNPELGIDVQAELLPYNINYEFPRNKLKLGKQLGSGAFGIVMQAEAFGIISKEEKTTVAVKTVKEITDNLQMKELISELKIMVHLGQHLNVVNLLGACTQNITRRELLVIVEYCPYGNLYNYLLRNRKNYIDQIDSATGNIDYSFGLEVSNDKNTSQENDLPHSFNIECSSNYCEEHKESIKSLLTKDIISWAFQIARGMEYLASRKIVHGDLAARNILLAENNIVKICDFGLAKRMYKRTNYKKQKDCPLPIKWMAVESIRDRAFSMQSDVWSYGIVLWEIFSLAQSPYPAIESDEMLYHKLRNGYKMASPPYAPKEMYKIMCNCWDVDPSLRPCFNKLAGTVGLMLEENIRQHYVDLNDPYFAMNTQRLIEGQEDYLMILSSPEYLKIVSPNGINEGGIKGYLSVINIADSVSNNGDIPMV